MNLDKISVTLYDLLGYLLPGYLLLLAASLVEANFFKSDLLSLSNFGRHALPFTIVAYFLGHVSHALASIWKEKCPKWFQTTKYALPDPVAGQVQQRIQETFGVIFTAEDACGGMYRYLMADAYIVAKGSNTEREILVAREGFFKSSMVAFLLLTLVLTFCAFLGGASLRVQPRLIVHLSWAKTVVAAGLSLIAALLFRQRFLFFNAVKRNNAHLIFLALQASDNAKDDQQK